MGAGIGPNFGNTVGSKIETCDNTAAQNSEPKIVLPEKEAQLKHIFNSREGHLQYTVKNQEKILYVANNDEFFYGCDSFNNKWFAEVQKNGSQIWVKVRNNVIQDAGLNKIPRVWDTESGFNVNPKKNKTWRKKK